MSPYARGKDELAIGALAQMCIGGWNKGGCEAFAAHFENSGFIGSTPGVSDADETFAGSAPLNSASKPEVCAGVDNELNDGVDDCFANTDGDSQECFA